jgi:predicted RNase H-like HicB family nuclease
MCFTIEVEQEEDGRWLAEIPQIPGVLAYGPTRERSLSVSKYSRYACWRTV